MNAIHQKSIENLQQSSIVRISVAIVAQWPGILFAIPRTEYLPLAKWVERIEKCQKDHGYQRIYWPVSCAWCLVFISRASLYVSLEYVGIAFWGTARRDSFHLPHCHWIACALINYPIIMIKSEVERGREGKIYICYRYFVWCRREKRMSERIKRIFNWKLSQLQACCIVMHCTNCWNPRGRWEEGDSMMTVHHEWWR